MSRGPSTPIPGSYWVDPGRLLAGEYPGSSDPAEADVRLRRFGESGVTLFVDLTEAVEPLAPYHRLLVGARHERRPIPDFGVVGPADYAEILDLVDAELAAGGCVYVHCRGGIGRTGTVVGCWLVRHGREDGDAIGRIAALRAGARDWFVPSPQTPAQEKVVRGWRRHD